MTQPKTAMEAFQAAKDAEERVFAEEMARTDNGVLAGAFGEKAAAAVLEAWKDEQVRELQTERDDLHEALGWVIGADPGEKYVAAMKHAREVWNRIDAAARTLLAGERGA